MSVRCSVAGCTEINSLSQPRCGPSVLSRRDRQDNRIVNARPGVSRRIISISISPFVHPCIHRGVFPSPWVPSLPYHDHISLQQFRILKDGSTQKMNSSCCALAAVSWLSIRTPPCCGVSRHSKIPRALQASVMSPVSWTTPAAPRRRTSCQDSRHAQHCHRRWFQEDPEMVKTNIATTTLHLVRPIIW